VTTIRKVDPQAHGSRVLELFDENAEDTEHPRAVLAEGEGDLWLAEDGERLAGILLARRMIVADKVQCGGIDNLLVDLSYRGRGIGRSLMEAAEAYYINQKLERVRLAVNVENSTALRLYQSMGYKVVSEYVRPRGEQRRFIMEKVASD
jgi:ribosomal protein S18 acetylase RimI-like enzyme